MARKKRQLRDVLVTNENGGLGEHWVYIDQRRDSFIMEEETDYNVNTVVTPGRNSDYFIDQISPTVMILQVNYYTYCDILYTQSDISRMFISY